MKRKCFDYSFHMMQFNVELSNKDSVGAFLQSKELLLKKEMILSVNKWVICELDLEQTKACFLLRSCPGGDVQDLGRAP